MTATSAAASLMAPDVAPLPPAGNVLAVTARPGQESADLGGLLYAFRRTGASLALLCLTRGEASPLNSTSARLEAIRPWELQLAASILGISRVTVASYPDGALCRYPTAELTDRVRRAIHQHSADLLLVIDPAADDPDDTAGSHGCLRCRQAGRRAGHGAHSAACPRQLDDRSGHRSRRRPRHPEIRRGRARQPVRRIAPADTPP